MDTPSYLPRKRCSWWEFAPEASKKRTIEVIFDGEVFRPEEPVDLQPNTHYRMTIEVNEKSPDGEPALTPGVFDDILALARDDLDLPPDFAAQLDHYLYGTPKR